MKKVLKIIGIIVSVIIIIYLISIPVLRAKFPVQENAFFTPTPFVKDSIKKIFLIIILFIFIKILYKLLLINFYQTKRMIL